MSSFGCPNSGLVHGGAVAEWSMALQLREKINKNQKIPGLGNLKKTQGWLCFAFSNPQQPEFSTLVSGPWKKIGGALIKIGGIWIRTHDFRISSWALDHQHPSFRMLRGQEIQHKFMDSGFKSRIFFKYLRYFFLHTLFLQISITVIEIAATSSVSGDSPLNKT